MTSIDDSSEYYRFRESRERQLEQMATDDVARTAHRVMAEKYRELAEQAEAAGH